MNKDSQLYNPVPAAQQQFINPQPPQGQPQQQQRQPQQQQPDPFIPDPAIYGPPPVGNYRNMNAQQPPKSRWVLGKSPLFGAVVHRSFGAEILNKLNDKINEVIKISKDNKATAPNIDLISIPVDRQNTVTSLYYSCIIIAGKFNDNTSDMLSYYILILASTNERKEPKIRTEGNLKITQIIPPDLAYNSILKNEIASLIKRQFPNMRYKEVGACVVPENFNSDDKENIQNLAYNSTLAVSTELYLQVEKDLNLKTVDGLDSNFLIKLLFNKNQITSLSGEPIRSDLIARLLVQNQTSNSQCLLNDNNSESYIADIGGYIDLTWAPTQLQQYNNGMAVPNVPKYIPNFIITTLNSYISYSPSSIMLTIAIALSICNSNNWIQVFRPDLSKTDLDIKDIGALTIEGNLGNHPSGYGPRLNTKSETFKLEDLGVLVGTLIRTDLTLSIDVPIAGPNTWFLNMLREGANGPGYEKLYDTCEQLTGGEFGKLYLKGNPILAESCEAIHLGYYTDRYGNVRDIRDIDYLAVSNLVGDKSPELIRQWSDTFNQIHLPSAIRLTHRHNLLESLTGGTVVITGFAQRITFNGQFLMALVAACSRAGLGARVVSPLENMNILNLRGAPSYLESAMINSGVQFFNSISPNYRNIDYLRPYF